LGEKRKKTGTTASRKRAGGADNPGGGRTKKVIILGGGPNRIGQGIEFDYCCVHAAYAIKEAGFIAILINSNPETVSTDFDTSDKLYFEPLTFEDVMNIIDVEKPHGVIVQLGGQTPLNLATALMRANVPILGTSPDSIDRAENRKRFKALLDKLNLTQPDNATATSVEEAVRKARRIGYPLLVRPSYVLGGRAMRIIYEEADLSEYMLKAVEASPDHPVLLDRFLMDAIEVDVDAVADGQTCIVCGVMEHIEQAGVHSGDSACCLPPYSLGKKIVEEIKKATRALASELGVVGLMNVQYAINNNVLYVLEVNPRASRTVPFVSKATGIPWAKVATRVMLGQSLKSQGITKEVTPCHISVKEAVFPFSRFPGVDATLGPEMLSTGEVMGIDRDFGAAFVKSQIAAGQRLPKSGSVFISVNDNDKRAILPIAEELLDMGFKIVATAGTADTLRRYGIAAELVHKIGEHTNDVISLIKTGRISLMINTPGDKAAKIDEAKIRSTAVARDIALITTIAGALATVQGMKTLRRRGLGIKSIQKYHREVVKEADYTKIAKNLQGSFVKTETGKMDFCAVRDTNVTAGKKKAAAAKPTHKKAKTATSPMKKAK
jgi:carbamoyl-phosphate synthase large subunit